MIEFVAKMIDELSSQTKILLALGSCIGGRRWRNIIFLIGWFIQSVRDRTIPKVEISQRACRLAIILSYAERNKCEISAQPLQTAGE